MQRTRDWRRARTRAVWRKRAGYRNAAGGLTTRETPCPCSCGLCAAHAGRPDEPVGESLTTWLCPDELRYEVWADAQEVSE